MATQNDFVTKVKDDLLAVSDFVLAQAAAGQDTSSLLDSQANLSTQQLNCLKTVDVKLSEATELTQNVNAGPWTDPQEAMLSAIIQGLASHAGLEQQAQRRAFQHLRRFLNFQTQPEWDGLYFNASVMSKIQQMPQRANACGVGTPL